MTEINIKAIEEKMNGVLAACIETAVERSRGKGLKSQMVAFEDSIRVFWTTVSVVVEPYIPEGYKWDTRKAFDAAEAASSAHMRRATASDIANIGMISAISVAAISEGYQAFIKTIKASASVKA